MPAPVGIKKQNMNALTGRLNIVGEKFDCGTKLFPPRDICPFKETLLDRELEELRQLKAANGGKFKPLTEGATNLSEMDMSRGRRK